MTKAGPETVLLLNAATFTVVPLSTDAFRVAHGRQSKLLPEYLGAYVLYPTGTLRVITGITFGALVGGRWGSRAFSLLNGFWRHVEVRMTDYTDRPLERVKSVVADCQKHAGAKLELFMEDTQLAALDRDWLALVDSLSEVYAKLELPAPRDALDVMC